ncbi:hypothetical protein BJ322DRAFT_1213405 [Thelephora terrestris]|uniref:Fungal-type protein kinase domain-containing protein n=1 Tax=Thelephora terrestris TaxID=56493 RepID=A0A9P6L435_9AGAM|nr:hypothetical protein BJ322DRAFT_1213405 [Thelephora terrestris]
MSASTSHQSSSEQTVSDQLSIQGVIEEEIVDQTFLFSSSELARILSPKKPKTNAVLSDGFFGIDDYDCTVDGSAFGDALDDLVGQLPSFSTIGTAEQGGYKSLANFLTESVTACYNVLDKRNEFPKRPERWYSDLEFVVGISMADGTEDAAVLRDIMGGNGISKLDERLFCKPPADQFAYQTMLPVEVNNCWRAMVAQAATYARSLFGANPMRVFALILGFNHDDNQLRFLVFHRGGLAASHPYDLTQEDGLKEVARLFLTLVSWRTAAEAGFIACGNETTHLLPVDKEGEQHVRAKVTHIFLLLLPTDAPPACPKAPEKQQPRPEQTKGEQIQTDPDAPLKCFRPLNFQSSAGSPVLSDLTGTVVLKASWPSIDRRRNEADMLKDCGDQYGVTPHVSSYEVTGEHGEAISNILFFPKEHEIKDRHWSLFTSIPPKTRDIRTYQQFISNCHGKSLTTAENPRQLSRGLRDCLLGWLSVYMRGYLHMDPSMGNIMLAPVGHKEGFKIPDVFLDCVSSLTDKLVAKLGVSTKASAVITDGDLAIPWEKFLDLDCRAVKSGTPEFMSRVLLDATGDYLHSPVDDLESLFWVALWSVVFNEKSGEKWEAERWVREALIDHKKGLAIDRFRYLEIDKGRNEVTQRFQAVIRDWWKKLPLLREHWIDQVLVEKPRVADPKYYLPHFHRFALRGVLDVLGVLHKHWDGEISWESWSRPE